MTPTEKKVSMCDLNPVIEGLIKSGTDVEFTVTGVSMVPTFMHMRDSVILTACDPQKLKKGQIPLYRRKNGAFILHRIVKVHETTYDCLGDHQTEIEKGVCKDAVICVVKGYKRKGKYHECGTFGDRLYVGLWIFLRPLRPYILAAYYKTRRFLFGRKK